MKRVYIVGFAEATGAGWDPSWYEGSDVPGGTCAEVPSAVGRLDFKVWTRSGRGLSCYFTRDDGAPEGPSGDTSEGVSGGVSDSAPGGASDGRSDDVPSGALGGSVERYRIAAFPFKAAGSRWTAFGPRDGSVDVSTAAVPGDPFRVTVGRTSRGNVRWASAEQVGPFVDLEQRRPVTTRS